MSVDQNTFDPDIERQKAQIKYDSDFKIEAFKAAIQYGLDASRAVFILNGGAILSLLTFWGNVAAKVRLSGLAPVWMVLPVVFFIAGLILGTACTAAAYWSQGQYSYRTEQGELTGKRFQRISVRCGLGGAICFLVGAFSAALSLAKVFDAVCP